MEEREVLLDYRNVSLGYGGREVLRSVSFTLRRGDFLGVVGPNGAGKTTLLRSMFGLITPRAGEIVAPRRGLRFGYVPQRQDIDEVFPLTAREVVTMGLFPELGLVRRAGAAQRKRVDESLDRVGAFRLGGVAYRDLSGGQKQRVLIARALVRRVDALLLDEPTHDMDIAAEHGIMELVAWLHRAERIAVVMVSHLLNLVAGCADIVAIINRGRFIAGPTDEIINAERLSRVYGVPVGVGELDGRRVVTVREEG